MSGQQQGRICIWWAFYAMFFVVQTLVSMTVGNGNGVAIYIYIYAAIG